jgi:uncharacterized protein YuzE
LAWVQFVIDNPQTERVQADGRIRKWAAIADCGGRWLRVVLLADGETVHKRLLRPEFHDMKIRYFEDTDTLFIELKAGSVVETRDLDENTLLDLDAHGQVLAITLEHATEHAEISSFSFDRIAA